MQEVHNSGSIRTDYIITGDDKFVHARTHQGNNDTSNK